MARNTRRSLASLSPTTTNKDDDAMLRLAPKDVVKQAFGRRIQKLMSEHNMTQADLARASGMGRDAISTYINGRCFPEPESLKKLARVFKIEPHELNPQAAEVAMNNEIPALEIRQAIGHPDKVWIRVNQMVDRKTAAKIFDALNNPQNASEH